MQWGLTRPALWAARRTWRSKTLQNRIQTYKNQCQKTMRFRHRFFHRSGLVSEWFWDVFFRAETRPKCKNTISSKTSKIVLPLWRRAHFSRFEGSKNMKSCPNNMKKRVFFRGIDFDSISGGFGEAKTEAKIEFWEVFCRCFFRMRFGIDFWSFFKGSEAWK